MRVVLACVALVSVFVVARLAVAADGDISRFVVAGTTFTDVADPPPIHLFDSDGYDGQFYWRLAVDPSDLGPDASHGVRLDQPRRAGRIAYPALAWLVGAGQEGLMRWSLVGVNVLAFGLASWSAARLARLRKVPAAWGALVIATSGVVMSLARDLTETLMVAALLAGVLALRVRRPALAAVAWSVAVLTHEQSIVVVVGYAVAHAATSIAARKVDRRVLLPVVAPAIAFVGWQAVVRAQTGRLPILDSQGDSMSWPFIGLVRAARGWLTGSLERQELLVFPQLALTIALVVVAWRRRSHLLPEDRWLLAALATATLMAVSLSTTVWAGPAELRQIVLVPVFAALVIVMARPSPRWWLTGSVTVVWVATAALRSVAI